MSEKPPKTMGEWMQAREKNPGLPPPQEKDPYPGYVPAPIPPAGEQMGQMLRYGIATLIFLFSCFVPFILLSGATTNDAANFVGALLWLPVAGLVGALFSWCFMAVTRSGRH